MYQKWIDEVTRLYQEESEGELPDLDYEQAYRSGIDADSMANYAINIQNEGTTE